MKTITIIYNPDSFESVELSPEQMNVLFHLLNKDENMHQIAETAVAYRIAESPKPLLMMSNLTKVIENITLGVLPSGESNLEDIYPDWYDSGTVCD